MGSHAKNWIVGVRSQNRAAVAWSEGRFDGQIIPFDVHGDGSEMHLKDEGLRDTTYEALANLKPIAGVGYFSEPAKFHTAGTASQLADASSALLVMSREKADELGLTPLARVVSSCLVGSDPALMLTGPIPATQKLLDDTGYSTDDIDIFEINEALLLWSWLWAKEMKIEIDDRVNPNGGAIAIGHALGSTGPLLITKTVHELHRSNGKLGLISMCCGGGLEPEQSSNGCNLRPYLGPKFRLLLWMRLLSILEKITMWAGNSAHNKLYPRLLWYEESLLGNQYFLVVLFFNIPFQPCMARDFHFGK